MLHARSLSSTRRSSAWIGAWALVVLGIVTSACGSDVDDVSDGAGGSAGSGASAGSGGIAGGGAGGLCGGFEDASSVGTMTLRITNDDFQPVYIRGNCGPTPALPLAPVTGPNGFSYVNNDPCLQTCEDLQTEEPEPCAADACAPTAIQILPGETVETTWNGIAIDNAVPMPIACYDTEPGEGATCRQMVQAPVGDYELSIIGYQQCENCDCGVGDDYCIGDPSGLEATPTGTVFTYPGTGEAELVFETCAFGCAEG